MDKAGSLAAAMSMFPLVGAAIGAFGGGLYVLASHILWPLPAALIAVSAMIVMAGALHEDGLADFADGLGARGDRDFRLLVMRDPHVGVFGALAVAISVLLRAALLSSSAGAWDGLMALIAAGALSRAAIPALMQTLPPARADGLGAAAGVPDVTTVALGAFIAIDISLLSVGFGPTLIALMATILGAAAIGLTAKRALGGFTGDVLGAVQQICEIAALIGVFSRW